MIEQVAEQGDMIRMPGGKHGLPAKMLCYEKDTDQQLFKKKSQG